MLCCWLQQLQDFGGPEVEKPDLLQGSVGSLRPHLQASNGSLARHAILNDPRVRYNVSAFQIFFSDKLFAILKNTIIKIYLKNFFSPRNLSDLSKYSFFK